MTTALVPDTLTDLRRKLTRLRRAVRLWHLVNGLCWGLWAALLVMAVDLGIDRLFRLDRPSRAIMLLLMLAAVGAVLGYRLVRPLAARLTDQALCLWVDRHHGRQMNEAVISAWQLGQVADAAALGYSPALVRRVLALGVQAAGPVDFSDVIDRRARNRRLAGLLGAVAVAAALAGAFPQVVGLYVQRNLALGQVQWPQQTHLYLVGLNQQGQLVVPRGDDVRFQVRFEGRRPDRLVMTVRPAHGRRYSRQMKSIGPDRYELLVRNVLEEMELTVRGGDGRLGPVPVRLVERPAVAGLDLSVRPPAYTGLPPADLPPARGAYDVPAGSTLLVRGRLVEQPGASALARAVLLDGSRTIATTDPDDSGRGFELVIEPAALHSGSYGVELVDVNGLKSRQPVRFSLRVVPDAAPMIRARLNGIGDLVTPRATVPIDLRITDDYAVQHAWLVYLDPSAPPADGDQSPPQKTQPITGLADSWGRRTVGPVLWRWELAPLQLPLGTHLTFHLAARDNDAFSGPKTGHGSQFSLKVVSDEELRGELLRREQEQRMEFERLLNDQRSWQVSVRALAAALGPAGSLNPAQRQQLKNLERQQRLAAGRCLAIADHFRQTLAEVENNHLEEAGGPMHQRMAQRIIAPLEQLAGRQIPAAAEPLDRAGQPAVEPAQRRQALEQAVTLQRRIIEQMKQVLASMVKVEGYQEAVNLLRQILKTQGQVNAETIKALEEQINRIFDQ